jgi:hypothetical protein
MHTEILSVAALRHPTLRSGQALRERSLRMIILGKNYEASFLSLEGEVR